MAAEANLVYKKPTKTLLPAPLEREPAFLSIYQGTAINALQKTIKQQPDRINDNGRAEITKDSLTLFIEDWDKLTTGIKGSTIKLILAGIAQLTRQNTYKEENPERIKNAVLLNFDEYMSLRDLKDRKDARKQVKEDCDAIMRLRMSWNETDGRIFDMLSPFYRAFLTKSGYINLSFAPEIAHYLVNAYEMKLPDLYWAIKDGKNPNSAAFLYRISLLKKINRGTKSEDIISVKTLLDNASCIPDYDTVMQNSRAVGRKIIEPFERDMNALSESIEWEYCHEKGTPLTEEELLNLSYTVFIELKVKITWKNYPLTEYVEAQQERQEVREAKETKKKRRTKKG